MKLLCIGVRIHFVSDIYTSSPNIGFCSVSLLGHGHLTMRVTKFPIGLGRRKVDRYTLQTGENVAFERQGTVFIEVIVDGAGFSDEQLNSMCTY